MPIHSRKNQYRGVNAHLHSLLQQHGAWETFHGDHVTDLGRAIAVGLPEGYLVSTERSLQVREFSANIGERIRYPKPDVTVYSTRPVPETASASAMGVTIATYAQPVLETLDMTQEDYYASVILYRVADDSLFGRPVTRIELLSPSNKAGDGDIQYREKRRAAIRSGLNLVEIDYLHETPSPIRGVPDYLRRQPGSYPYNITISSPHPTPEEGLATTYAFRVDTEIPTLEIPLEGTDTVRLNFNAVYNTTFESLPTFSKLVDYEQLPARFETYDAYDQQQIQRRMQAVQAAVASGESLDNAPLPLEEAG